MYYIRYKFSQHQHVPTSFYIVGMYYYQLQVIYYSHNNNDRDYGMFARQYEDSSSLMPRYRYTIRGHDFGTAYELRWHTWSTPSFITVN